MYEFLTGPALWISFGIFFVGLLFRMVQYILGLDWKVDRVTYTQNIGFGIKDIHTIQQYLSADFDDIGKVVEPVEEAEQ